MNSNRVKSGKYKRLELPTSFFYTPVLFKYLKNQITDYRILTTDYQS